MYVCIHGYLDSFFFSFSQNTKVRFLKYGQKPHQDNVGWVVFSP